MANLSIKFRIAGLAGLCILCTVGALVFFSIKSIDDIATIGNESSSKILGASSLQYMQAQGVEQAQALSQRFSAAQVFGNTLMRQMVYLRTHNEKINVDPSATRKSLMEMLQRQVEAFPNVLGVGVGFLPHAMDVSDAKFIDDASSGSNETGRFAPYASTQVPSYVMSDKEMADDGTPGTFWFTCALKSGKDCVTNPYSFTNQDGATTLMSTVSIPILDGNARLGAICIDIGLNSLQKIVDESSQQLYGGKSQITFVSADGVVAARSGEASSVGRKLSEVDTLTGAKVIGHLRDGGTAVVKGDGTTSVVALFAPIAGADNWAVVIKVPDDVIFASSNALRDQLQEASNQAGSLQASVGILAAFIGILILWLMAGTITRPILRVAAVFRDIASGGGDLTRRVEYGREDEVGKLTSAFNDFLDKLQPIIRQVSLSADGTGVAAEEAALGASKTSTSMQEQLREVDQAASASLQMSATSQEVARNAALAANAVGQVDAANRQGQTIVNQTTQSISTLSSKLDLALQQVESLAATSLKIGGVLDVINSVAEQTNLLALNAAIEAARAGESGRGFAVVADEVRHLAKRTQDSVAEIQVVVEQLQTGTGRVVGSIRESHKQAGESVKIVEVTVQKFHDINRGIEVISDMTLQIASAAEEQSAVSEEVTRNIAAIRDVAQSLAQKAEDSVKVNQSLSEHAKKQKALMSNFKA